MPSRSWQRALGAERLALTALFLANLAAIAPVVLVIGILFAKGLGAVKLPNGVRTDGPLSSREWGWQWVFPATSHYVDPTTGERRRHHLHETVLQKAFKIARLRAGILPPATCQSLRQSFASHMLEDGYDVRTVQELLGHKNVKSTLKYESVLNRPGPGVRSPADWVGEKGEEFTPMETRNLP